DTRQPHAGGVVGKVAPSADCDLQHLSVSLGADPLAAAAEENLLEEAHLPVVARRELVHDLADSLRFRIQIRGSRGFNLRHQTLLPFRLQRCGVDMRSIPPYTTTRCRRLQQLRS